MSLRMRFVGRAILAGVLAVVLVGTFTLPQAKESIDSLDLTSPSFYDPDCYVWTRIVEDAAQTGSWRETNVPWDFSDGRPNYWNKAMVGAMAAASHVVAWGGVPIKEAVVLVGGWFSPISLLAGAFLIGVVAAATLPGWRGLLASVAIPLIVGTFPVASAPFTPLRPDHHAWISISLVCAVIGFFGLIRDKSPGRALIFGVFLGALFWLSTLTAVMVAGFMGVGLLVIVTRGGGFSFRAYAYGAGGLLGVMIPTYLIDNLPAFPLRLEINSPLLWLGLSAALFLVGVYDHWIHGRQCRPWHIKGCWIAGLALVLLSAAILFMGDVWFFMFDPLARTFTNQVGEMLPLTRLPWSSWLAIIVTAGVVALGRGWTKKVALFVLLAGVWLAAWQHGRNHDIALATTLTIGLCVSTSIAPIWLLAAFVSAGAYSQSPLWSGRPWYPGEAAQKAAAALNMTTPHILATGDDALVLAYFANGTTVGSFFWEGYMKVGRMHNLLSETDPAVLEERLVAEGVDAIILPVMADSTEIRSLGPAGVVPVLLNAAIVGESTNVPGMTCIGDFYQGSEGFRVWTRK